MSFHHSKCVTQKFKSPLKNDTSAVKLEKNALEEYKFLAKKNALLDHEISALSANPAFTTDSVANVMSLLHEFNEIKDATQVVLGKLASIEGKTLKELHEQFGLLNQE
ncbi:DNA repair protein SWI5-like protein [Frankliniella fusca]|uniref:DNA repair protein SWI5 homolog n=1 Tax=Frankliniella fusca TaxID=407009 RepID=A0AAE1H3G9_9NEOP|nr:DNA repair protein SWI5-like protein [Frankliniella fusca]